MTMPSGVPSNATNVLSGNAAAIPAAGAGAVLDLPVSVCINNQSGTTISVNIYICIDCNTSSPTLIHARPMVWYPGQTAQDVFTRISGVSAGTHQIDVFMYATNGGVTCPWCIVNGKTTMA